MNYSVAFRREMSESVSHYGQCLLGFSNGTDTFAGFRDIRSSYNIKVFSSLGNSIEKLLENVKEIEEKSSLSQVLIFECANAGMPFVQLGAENINACLKRLVQIVVSDHFYTIRINLMNITLVKLFI